MSGLNLINYSLVHRFDTHWSEHYSRLITLALNSALFEKICPVDKRVTARGRRASVLGVTIDENQAVYSYFTSFFMRDSHRPGSPLRVEAAFRTSSPSNPRCLFT